MATEPQKDDFMCERNDIELRQSNDHLQAS